MLAYTIEASSKDLDLLLDIIMKNSPYGRVLTYIIKEGISEKYTITIYSNTNEQLLEECFNKGTLSEWCEKFTKINDFKEPKF